MLPIEKDPIAPGNNPKPHKVEPAQKTWFFQRETGDIFACHNDEAVQLLKKLNNYQRSLKLIGCSDGTIFRKAVEESHRVFNETKDIAQAQAILRKGEQDEIEVARTNRELPVDRSRITFGKTA